MPEKLCLQWSDFKDNVNSAFGKLRSGSDFTDVTLTCGDGQHFEAHKVVLAASSPFFEKIFQKTKHPCPLIYLGEFKSNHFAPILDFLYFGEANVFQEDLDSFLSIAEELMLKGLTGQTSKDLLEQREKLDRIETSKAQSGTNQELKLDRIDTATKSEDSLPEYTSENIKTSKAQSGATLQELDEEVKPMMEGGQTLLPAGKQPNGSPKQDLLDQREKLDCTELAPKRKELFPENTISTTDPITSDNIATSRSGTNLQELDEMVKSMMERGQKL